MSIFSRLRRLLIGKPIASKHAHHERLSNVIALPVFASDALSSVAYATEAIMGVLLATSAVLLGHTLPISVVIVGLIVLVAISYNQTLFSYPKGGGSYTVASENLGERWGMIAAASLLIDYILTVSVSVSAGILALVSLYHGLQAYIVPMGLAAILLMTFANLRGAKESGAVFAVPTYTFVAAVVVTIIAALVKGAPPQTLVSQLPPPKAMEHFAGFALLSVVLKAFSGGCTALTGIEAISNGVQAFREPVSKNASRTLTAMAIILAFLFIGISFIATRIGAVPMSLHDGLTLADGSKREYMTILAQIAQHAFGGGWMFSLVQLSTCAILILAANTAYADFPRLASLIARDGYIPRQFSTLGDRLVFKNGIIVLALVACLLIVAYRGDTEALLPLYAIGVFLCFSLSQFGMVKHNMRENQGRITGGVILSAAGGTITAIVMVVLIVEKAREGAWMVPFAIGGIYAAFAMVKRHYRYLATEMEPLEDETVPSTHTTTLLLVPRVHRGVLRAIAYAQSTSIDCRALHVTLDPKTTGHIKEDWIKYGGDMPLVILESPYRSLVEPVIKYIDQAQEEDPNLVITVIVPQTVPKHWWHAALHNNIAVPLKLALGQRRNVVVTNIRYHLK